MKATTRQPAIGDRGPELYPAAGAGATQWTVETLFGVHASGAWVTKVSDVADKPQWAGGRYEALRPALETSAGTHGHYLNTTIIKEGKKHRTNDDSASAMFLFFDDCGDATVNPDVKMDRMFLDILGPTPTLVTETSENNFQYVYAFDKPVPMETFKALNRALRANPATEGGFIDGNDGVRYARLPSGVNPKAGRGNFSTRLVEASGKKHSVEELVSAFGLNLAPRDPQDPDNLGRKPDRGGIAEIEPLLFGPDAPLRNDKVVSYKDYIDLLIFVHGATGGSAEGLDLVVRWGAERGHKEGYDPASKWQTIHEPRGGAHALWTMALKIDWTNTMRLIFPPLPDLEDDQPNDKSKARPRFRTLAAFIAEYKPIADIVDGLLSMGCLYTLTATTGTGKTAWLSSTALAIGAGRNDILGREVMKGRVAFSTAENPDGLKMRLGVNAFHWNIDPEVIGYNVLVSDTRVSPEAIYEELERDAREHGPFTAVFVDTWQAFFDGRDSSKPVEAVEFTRRFRPFARLPGNPAVVLATHPVKNASDSELIPYGGGSILNEIDGNFTLSRQPSGLVAFGWLGKLRGLDFEPPLYRIENKTSPGIVNIKGELVKIPVMLPTSQAEAEDREAAVADRDIRILRAVVENPQASLKGLEMAARVTHGTLHRGLNKLSRARPTLVRNELGKWVATKAGKEALKMSLEG
jgi:hypothetical protein